MNKDLQLVLEHLMYEGYADNYNSAAKIINSMSDEWLFGILDEVRELNPIYTRRGAELLRGVVNILGKALVRLIQPKGPENQVDGAIL